MPTALRELPLARLTVPEGWDVRAHFELVAPSVRDAVPLAGKAGAERPGGMLSIVRGVSDKSTPKSALEAFLAELATETPGLKRLGEGEVTFDDGIVGYYADVSFEAGESLRVLQRHQYRVDGGVITHLTASVLEHEKKRLEQTFVPLMLALRPS